MDVHEHVRLHVHVHVCVCLCVCVCVCVSFFDFSRKNFPFFGFFSVYFLNYFKL